MSTFVSVIRMQDEQHVIIRRDAIRFVEPIQDGAAVMIHVDGIGEVATRSYDIYGFASAVVEVDLSEAA